MDSEPTQGWRKHGKRLGAALLLLGVAVILVHELVLSVYQVRGVSMEPALHDGQRVLVLKSFYEVARGDQLVFKNPNAPDEVLVKRVLFLPKERFEVEAGRIRVASSGQEPLQELAASHLHPGAQGLGRILGSQVPADSYFLVGDNLPESIDSRTLGAIPGRLVVGKVVRALDP